MDFSITKKLLDIQPDQNLIAEAGDLLGVNLLDAKNSISKIDFDELVELYYDDPIAFMEDVLLFYPDEKQKEIIRAVLKNKRTSVRAGQGVGKTAVEACLIIWYMMFRYEAKIIATAPTAQQLNIVLWAEISKWLTGTYAENYLYTTKTYVYRKGFESVWFTNAKTATQKERMLGLHADNMMILCDEAPGIADDILEVLLGTISGPDNKILLIGNPTRNSGIFFDSHNINKEDFATVHISSRDCERTDKKNIKMMERKYGKDSNVVRVFIDGEFPLEEDDVFIQLSEVMNGINNCLELGKEIETLDIGVDVARFGGDSTVIAAKIDHVIPPLITHQGKDTMKTAGKVMILAKELHHKYPDPVVVVKVDDTGVGGGVTDRLREIKNEENLYWLKIIGCKFGIPLKKGSPASVFYYDTTTFWASVVKRLLSNVDKKGIEKDIELTLPNDLELIGQLTNRKYEIKNSKGQIKLESKDEMKKRGLTSPDKADAVYLACKPVTKKQRMPDKNNNSSPQLEE